MVTDRDCIYIFNEEEMWLKIMMRDIYYIETRDRDRGVCREKAVRG